MRKKTKALSGASRDAYFRRVLKEYPDISVDERDRLLRRLRREVAQVRVRVEPPRDVEVSTAALAHTRSPRKRQPAEVAVGRTEVADERTADSVAPDFDPFSPNVIVVLRQGGRQAALAALAPIDSTNNLRLLAREQRLNVRVNVSSAAELRVAIVAAAERRIANRLAAAS